MNVFAPSLTRSLMKRLVALLLVPALLADQAAAAAFIQPAKPLDRQTPANVQERYGAEAFAPRAIEFFINALGRRLTSSMARTVAITMGAHSAEVQGRTLSDALQDLVRQHPGLKERLYDSVGRLRSAISIFLNDEPIEKSLLFPSFTEGGRGGIRLAAGDHISILPAITGASGKGESAIDPIAITARLRTAFDEQRRQRKLTTKRFAEITHTPLRTIEYLMVRYVVQKHWPAIAAALDRDPIFLLIGERSLRSLNFGQRLEVLRHAKGLSRGALAEILRINPSTVFLYEKNKRHPSPEMIERLAKALEVTADVLQTESDEKIVAPAAELADVEFHGQARGSTNPKNSVGLK